MNVVDVTNKLAVVGGPKVQLAAAKVAKFSPQILTAVGVVGSVTSTVLIAKATLKVEPIMTEHEATQAIINVMTADGTYDNSETLSRSQDVRRMYTKTCLDLVKIYGPGVSIGLASLLSIVAAQGINQKRQVSLVAALKTAESTLQSYRARVIETIGADKEADIHYGLTTETVEDENGKKTKIKVFQAGALSDYQVMFDETNNNWQRGNRELNVLWLKNMQNWANDRLNARGFVYLNEVYSWLGLPQVPAGQVVGWMHKDFDNGDGYVDFGVDNAVNMPTVRFGERPAGILLDFNVDGEINSKL